MAADWDMIEALMDGTRAMRAGGKKWLPKFPMEGEDAYSERLNCAVLHPVFKRTVLVNAARPFSRPITLSDNSSQTLLDWMEDIDRQGSTLAVFCLRLMVQCLSK